MVSVVTKLIWGFVLLFSPLAAAEAAPTESQPPATHEESHLPDWLPSPNETAQQREERTAVAMRDLWVKTIFLLIAIIAFIFLMTYTVKRFHPSLWIREPKEGSMIRVLERRALSPKSCLYFVKIGETKMALAESASGVHFLSLIESEKELS